MRSSGSPQSVAGLFGGPGFLALCVVILGVAGVVAYLALSGELGGAGRAISVPGATVPEAQDAAQATAAGPLRSMPAAPIAKDMAVSFAIEEDLSPAELLAKYPPDPGAALSPTPEERPAWRHYGRESAILSAAPRVALVITGLGRNRLDTVRAITGAPPEASLSFDSESIDLAAWIAAARAYGHEAFLDVSLDRASAGNGLAVDQGAAENVRRLDAMLASAPMVVGVTVAGGGSFLPDAAALQPILAHLQSAGLAVIGLPVTAPLTVAADEIVAAGAAQDAIDRSLETAIAIARRRGAALGLVHSSSAAALFPAWQRALVGRDEIALVPASALVEE